MKRILALCALAPLGCAALATVPLGCLAGPGNKVWAKANAAYAGPGDYERAESACRRDHVLPGVAAGPKVSQEFVGCMRGHDWVLVKRP